MKCRIGFGFEKPKSAHLWYIWQNTALCLSC